MALSVTTVLLFIVLALARTDLLSTCQVLKAKVTCLDCKGKFDLSGIKVVVKCEKVKKVGMGTTQGDGSFEMQIPWSPPSNCVAKLVGGPKQLYGSRDLLVSNLIIDLNNSKRTSSSPNTYYYTTSKPLSVYTSCPSTAKLASSKTVDLPLPPEWGFAPSSLYFPFFPIIGIP